jgi:hypothetical protein
MIGPTCESSFEKMFDHVVAALPSNSSTRVSFENLNDFVKSSKRLKSREKWSNLKIAKK